MTFVWPWSGRPPRALEKQTGPADACVLSTGPVPKHAGTQDEATKGHGLDRSFAREKRGRYVSGGFSLCSWLA